jgi:hypothetical protein
LRNFGEAYGKFEVSKAEMTLSPELGVVATFSGQILVTNLRSCMPMRRAIFAK